MPSAAQPRSPARPRTGLPKHVPSQPQALHGGSSSHPRRGKAAPKPSRRPPMAARQGTASGLHGKAKDSGTGEQTTGSQSTSSEERARRWSKKQGPVVKTGKQPPHPIRALRVRLTWRPRTGGIKPKQPPTPSRPRELAGTIPSSSGEKPQIPALGTVPSRPCFATLLSQGDSGGVGRAGSA